MDELHGFCVRMLGPDEPARAAEQAARAAGRGDRISSLAAAAAACRERVTGAERSEEPPATPSESLAHAVAMELALATAKLPERQREALALRDLLRLPYDEISEIVGLEIVAVAPLLARARLRLRAELRGDREPLAPCAERDRALRTIARRQDAEDIAAADDDWLVEHLGHCVGCGRAHAAMLEASACYRAWRLETPAAAAARGVAASR